MTEEDQLTKPVPAQIEYISFLNKAVTIRDASNL
jgi:hypothetical protein